jgi:hypothetical protein
MLSNGGDKSSQGEGFNEGGEGVKLSREITC